MNILPMNQKNIGMETTTIVYFLIIAAATVLLVKMIQELFKYFAVILVVILGASGLYLFSGSNTVEKGNKAPTSSSELQVEKDKPMPQNDLFKTVGNEVNNDSKISETKLPTSSEMRQSAPLNLLEYELRQTPPAPAKSPTYKNYDLEDRISRVTKFGIPSYTLTGAYAHTLQEAKQKAADLKEKGFDHLFIIYLPHYAVEGAEGWPYAITITGPLSKLDNIYAAYDKYYRNNQVSSKMDVLELIGYN